MSIKIIDVTAIPDAQKLQEVMELASDIKGLHTLVTQKTGELETKKDQLRDKSVEMFYADISENPEVEVFEDHDYPTADGNVRVEFKVKGKPMEELNSKPAGTALREYFGAADFNKLFKEVTDYTVTAGFDQQIGQAVRSPELFSIGLRNTLTSDQYMTLVREHPDWVQINVADVPKYATTYPDSVKARTVVVVKGGFVENLSKVAKPTLKKLRKFIVAFLKPCLAPAVVCGNAIKKA